MPYPAAEPYDEGFLKVSEIHTLYYMQCGKPDGKPVLFLHGGPGGKIGPEDTVYFNPDIYRVVLFSQRGAGKSEPSAELRENTTWDLGEHLLGRRSIIQLSAAVSDIEKLREKLGIDKWMVFGGSWGSTLTLAYSETHPDRCTALIMRGIFLLRKSELAFFYQDGTSHIWPEYWEKYVSVIPPEERGNMMQAYYRRLTSDNDEISLTAAKTWSTWEESTCKLVPDPELIAQADNEPGWARAFARIECHYFVNNGFFPEGFLIQEEQIKKM
ncbi:hypothetical protein EHS25_008980 [Saitozyma podzolica]|uniref:Proline iminopeptidase n=1 Tax=Saitozyma podzolica TaxID=1890683 RepID=A0A427YKP2_9TREE|nr:hypothetical protein EHS25_008980 [Saitozyma podzolica]